MSEALLKVATGYRLVFWALILMLVTVAIAVIGLCVLMNAIMQQIQQAQQQQGGPPVNILDGARAMLILVGGLAVLSSLLALIGRLMCLATPPEASAAKALITISVVFEVLAIICNLVGIADNFGEFMSAQARLVTTAVSGISGIVAIVLFLLFSKSLADFIRRSDLAGRAMSTLWLWVGAGLCYVSAIGIVVASAGAFGGNQGGGGQGAACAGALLILVALIMGLLALIFYALLLSGMAAGLQRYARRNRDYDGDDDDDDDRPRGRRDDDYDDDDRGRRGRDDDDYEDDDRGGRPWGRGR